MIWVKQWPVLYSARCNVLALNSIGVMTWYKEVREFGCRFSRRNAHLHLRGDTNHILLWNILPKPHKKESLNKNSSGDDVCQRHPFGSAHGFYWGWHYIPVMPRYCNRSIPISALFVYLTFCWIYFGFVHCVTFIERFRSFLLGSCFKNLCPYFPIVGMLD